MPDYLNAFQDGLFAAINLVWPQLVEVWEVGNSAAVAWESHIVPYAVIELPDPQPADMGKGNLLYTQTVNIYYMDVFDGQIDATRDNLQLLQRYLFANRRIGGGIRMEKPIPSWDDALPCNIIFAPKNTATRGGRVSVSFLVGEMADPAQSPYITSLG